MKVVTRKAGVLPSKETLESKAIPSQLRISPHKQNVDLRQVFWIWFDKPADVEKSEVTFRHEVYDRRNIWRTFIIVHQGNFELDHFGETQCVATSGENIEFRALNIQFQEERRLELGVTL